MDKFRGIYSGRVVTNDTEIDITDKITGRIKVFVPSIYPNSMESTEKLPWARVLQPSFGSYQNYGQNETNQLLDLNLQTGICALPATGADVFVMFEDGDHNKPIVIGTIMGGTGWSTEHENQMVMKSHNVRIRIDERPDDKLSSCKHTTYNSKCCPESRPYLKKDQPTRLEVTIANPSGIAMNLNILGDVNERIHGDVFREVTGDIHETHIGNYYSYQSGDRVIVQDGNTHIRRTGNTQELIDGFVDELITQDKTEEVKADKTTIVGSNHVEKVGKEYALSAGSHAQIVAPLIDINF